MTSDLQRLSVIGAGTMGHGIALDFARAGCAVTLCDSSESALADALEKIGAADAPALTRIRACTTLADAAAEADLVIEAVYEDLVLKQSIFAELDRLCPPRTVLASNTSSFMPSLLASVTRRADRVLVAHYFYPPALLPLVELVCSPQTSEAALQSVKAAMLCAGKTPVVVRKETPGFIANRLQNALLREALFLVEQGIASPQDIDLAVKMSFGRRLAVKGPLETAEVQDGWDVIQVIHQTILPTLADSPSPSPVLAEQVRRGALGAKTGKGFYDWADGAQERWEQELFAALSAYGSEHEPA
jgi:3-hydroxybutyryl-CoA dehydrogenase